MKVVLERNVLAGYYQAASQSVQVGLIKSMDDVSCNNLPFFILEKDINEIKTKLQELIKEAFNHGKTGMKPCI